MSIRSLALATLCALLPCRGMATPYATLEGDTLRIGNSRIERLMQWNGGNVITVALTDKQTGLTLRGEGSVPDFTLLQGTPLEGALHVSTVPSDGIRREYLDACVTFRLGEVRVERHYRVFEDCPAIALDTWLSGSTDREEWESPATLDQLRLTGRHWQTRTVELTDRTDLFDNLVSQQDFVPMNAQSCRGNLLFARQMDTGMGFFMLKESPCPDSQLHYPGADFTVWAGHFTLQGPGLVPSDLCADHPVRAYTAVTGVYSHGEREALMALHAYQREARALVSEDDNMVMMNTWGERGEGKNISEEFCLRELERAAQLGINVFQIDAGWNGNYLDWPVSASKFPHGLHPVVQRARQLGIRMALWFSPHNDNDFAAWESDALILTRLYDEYGIDIFKIDGYNVPTLQAQQNLFSMLQRIATHTGKKSILNMDETAGQRVGYFTTAQYGNIFMENRYTDWGNYYPFHTLRNLWHLSRYVSAQRLQVEFLNPLRHPEKYAPDDPFAPCRYSLPYLFAITMAGQPLAWLEAHNLTPEQCEVSHVIQAYQSVTRQLHQGTILPIGSEPSGRSWTGFQSILSPTEGFLIVYRENNDQATHLLPTYLPSNARISLTAITGDGRSTRLRTDASGNLPVRLPHPNSFALYRYKVKR